MRLTLKEYKSSLNSKLEKEFNKDDLVVFKDNINFFMHERLVHLIITLFTGLILLSSIIIFIFTNNYLFALLGLILIILFVFYIKHYYYLENELQELYYIYNTKMDELINKR